MKNKKIYNINIAVVNPEKVLEIILHSDYSVPRYFCFLDMSVLTKALHSQKLQSIIDESFMAIPDGKPLEFFLRLKGFRKSRTISGYWLMNELLKSDLTHYFYGSHDHILPLMIKRIKSLYPQTKVAGYKCPPFFKDNNSIFSNETLKNDIAEINEKKPDIVWIGISSPKQDFLMNYMKSKLHHGHMFGVGAVFDYMAGTHKISPQWVKDIGFRWLYRLFQDPARLWKKYLCTVWLLIFYYLKRAVRK